jgi:hypothetical protein
VLGRIGIVLVAGAVVLASSSAATAQRWGSERTPSDGACFYQDPGFRGEYFCVRSGESMGTVPTGMNDRISSIRLFGSARVKVYQDGRFQGRSTRFNDDVRNLREEGWNDLISSLEVRGRESDDRRYSSGHNDRDRDRMTRSQAEDVVRRAYREVLRRDPDSGSRGYVDKVLRDGWTQRDVESELRKSDEYRNRR